MQTSNKKLASNQKKSIVDQLINVLADFDHPQQLKNFLKNFLTETELLVFAKRLAIAHELNQGKSYDEIKNQLNVSSATISTVAEIKDRHGMQQAYKLIQKDQKIDAWLKKFYN